MVGTEPPNEEAVYTERLRAARGGGKMVLIIKPRSICKDCVKIIHVGEPFYSKQQELFIVFF